MPDLWPAPLAGSVAGDINLPASKSATNRLLILGALSERPTILYSPLQAEDTDLMVSALRNLGVKIEQSDAAWKIYPAPLHGGKIYTGLAGTVMRFLLPLAALANGESLFHCTEQAARRPIYPLITALKDLGVEIETAGNSPAATFPLRIKGSGQITGGKIQLDAAASSQFISALLLAAPRFQHGLELIAPAPLPSFPYIEMTAHMLRQAGGKITELHSAEINSTASAYHWHIAPSSIQVTAQKVESDLSNAGPFLAGAMVSGGKVRIANWPAHSQQPGIAYLEIFSQMGGKFSHCHCAGHSEDLILTGPSTLQEIDVDCRAIGELVPTLAAVCAFASGTSYLRNIAHLRGHESDRLAALSSELAKVGVKARIVGGTDLEITPPHPQPSAANLPNTPSLPGGARHDIAVRDIIIDAHNDHRLATFGAILGMRIAGIKIAGIAATAKTFPDFPRQWKEFCR